MTKGQIAEIEQMLSSGFVATDGAVRAFEDPFLHVAEFLIPGNDGNVHVRILDEGPDFTPREYRYNCEAWIADDTGKRTSRVVTGNGADSPELAMSIAHWRALNERDDS